MKNSLVLLCAVCSAAWGADIYQVNTSVTAGGVDLTALSDAYRKDALQGVPAGANTAVAVTGTVTHASGLTAAHPFLVTNGVSKGYFVLKGSGLVGSTPVDVRGVSDAITYFAGDTLTIDETHPQNLFTWRGTQAQVDNLLVSSKTAPAQFNITNGTFIARYNTYIGRDGGTGAVYATSGQLGRTENGGAQKPWVGVREDSAVYLGSASAAGKGFAQGKLHVKNTRICGWHFYFGYSKNGLPPDDGAEHYAADVTLEGSDGLLWFLYTHVCGATDSILRFRGGYLWSEGWGTFIEFAQNSSANLICQGENGNPIDLRMTKFSQFVNWSSGATGHLILSGDCDVWLYGGDGEGQNDGYDTRGGVKFNDPNHRIEWLQTGDVRFKNWCNGPAKLYSNYFLPTNTWNGGVRVDTSSSAKFMLSLCGTSQRCNSLFGGGQVSNNTSTASTLSIGRNGNACTFDVALCAGGVINVVKEGAGAITLKKPVLDTFTLAEGRALVPADSTFAAGTLVTAVGTSFEVTGRAFTPPATYDLAGTDTATFKLVSGAALVVGGDGADQTVDFSKLVSVAGGILRKVGSNKVTLVNASTFNGSLDVQAGTLAFASDATTPGLASVTVAADATLEVAGGLRVEVGALTVRGTAGTTGTTYAAAADEGVTALTGLAGAGTVYVAPASGVWTGAVDDTPGTVGNWKDLLYAPQLVSGLFTPTFAEDDPNGAWNVGSALAFAGLVFNADVSSFTFNNVGGAGSIAVGASGLARETNGTCALTFNVPLVPTASSAWNLGTNVTLNLNAPLQDRDSGNLRITKNGDGVVNFKSTNSTYTGSFTFNRGRIDAYGEEPFGPQNAAGTADVITVPKNGTKLYLHNARTAKNIKLNNDSAYRDTLYCADHTTNTIFGNLSGGGVCRLQVPSTSMLILAGGYGSASDVQYINFGCSGPLVITNKSLYGNVMEGGIYNIRYYCPSNVLTKMASWSQTDGYSPMPQTAHFYCDWAFDRPGFTVCLGGTWNLHGHQLRIGALRNTGTICSWDGPATLYLANTTTGDNTKIPASTGNFAGELNLVVEGNAGYVFTVTNRALSATGTVTVASGTFRLAKGASWLNATNVTVTGGTFALTQSGQLAKTTDFNLSGGALDLAEGVVQKARWVSFDGTARPASLGTWGAVGNAAARHHSARLTGSGILNVLGDGKGLALVLR